VLFAAGAAHADEALHGEVLATQGRFADGGRLIVTDVVLRADDGREVMVTQLGGSAGGLAQKSWPAPPRLEVGMHARVILRDGLVAAVTPDPGFVRTGPTEGDHFLYWESGCIFIRYDAAGTEDLEGDLEFAVMDGVLAHWNETVSGCSYLELMSEGPTADEPAIGNDGVNRVVFRDDTWCRPDPDDAELCMSLPNGAAGLTTVTYVDDDDSSRDGQVVDADVELNGEEFAISHEGASLGSGFCKSDLANTFTHELGHVMGLDHTCLAPADPPKVDDDGDAVPACSETSDPEITEATMYNFQECGETKKASLEDDDRDAICTIYARGDDPGTCEPVSIEPGGCCSAGGGDPGAAALALLTTACLAGARRRRRSG
jgi:hypothetical protein